MPVSIAQRGKRLLPALHADGNPALGAQFKDGVQIKEGVKGATRSIIDPHHSAMPPPLRDYSLLLTMRWAENVSRECCRPAGRPGSRGKTEAPHVHRIPGWIYVERIEGLVALGAPTADHTRGVRLLSNHVLEFSRSFFVTGHCSRGSAAKDQSVDRRH